MKTIKTLISLAGLTGGLFAVPVVMAADAAAPAESTTPAIANPAAVPEVAPAATSTADTNAAADNGEKTIRLSFKDAPMETVLTYLSKAAGFVIHPMVTPSGRVTVTAEQPVSKEEALLLVENVLSANGYAVIRDDNILTIMSAAEAKRKEIPVKKFTRLEDIPRNSEVATWIIPVRTLNPVALVNNLRPLIGSDTDLQANESANSLLVTDSQNNVRRVADIVMQLDSVSSSINSIEVFPCKYADAKALADLVKQLFPSQDTSNGGRGNPAIGGFAGRGARGGRGGGGGGGGFPNIAQLLGGGATGPDNGSTPQSRISAVSDDHSNSLIVSAPEDLIPIIRDLVNKLDQPVEDITEVQVFHLKNADCTEMANLLSSLFPDPSGTDASARQVQFGGGRGGARGGAAGGRGGAGAFGAFGAAPTDSGSSEYMKKQVTVSAVPDPRTQSLIVSASKDMMPQIEDMINTLDAVDAGQLKVHRIALNNAEAQDVLQLVQDLFPSGNTQTRQLNNQNNPLQQRSTTMLQNFNSTGPGSGSTTSSGGGGAGRTATGF